MAGAAAPSVFTAVDVQCAVKYTDLVATPRRRSWLYRLVPAVLLIAAAGASVFTTGINGVCIVMQDPEGNGLGG